MTFDPMSVEVTCVTLPKDHCVQVPWQYINVCGYSDQFCKIPHTYTYYIHTTYIHTHTTYRMSDHIVSYWTQFRRDKNGSVDVTFERVITHQKYLTQSGRSSGAVRGVQWTFSMHSANLLKSQSEKKKFCWIVWIHSVSLLHLWQV